MLESIVFLVLSLGAILLGAELFTNGIEWFGHKLQLAEGAVGSVLAAVGTAMPETMIPIIAILFSRRPGGSDIGIGAILGAPLMLSTLAFFVSGIAVFTFTARGRRTLHMHVNYRVLARDLRWFMLVYMVAIGAAFLPSRPLKSLAAFLLLSAYAYYVHRTFSCGAGEECGHDLGRLHFHRREGHPQLRIIAGQVLIALALILGGAHVFVANLSRVAMSSGVSALVLASIIAPIATELPEKFNSVIWIRRKKDTLALGNISGAMVFQGCIPTAIGLLFTNWILTSQALAAAACAFLAALFVWSMLTIKKRLSAYALLVGVIFYSAYLIYTFAFSHR